MVLAEDRDNLAKYLADKGVETKIHYPVLLCDQPAFAKYLSAKTKADDFEMARHLNKRKLSLPIFAELTEDETGFCCFCHSFILFIKIEDIFIMAEINLMENYPKTKRDVNARLDEKTEKHRKIARKFGKNFLMVLGVQGTEDLPMIQSFGHLLFLISSLILILSQLIACLTWGALKDLC